jgi:hypothetical protein
MGALALGFARHRAGLARLVIPSPSSHPPLGLSWADGAGRPGFHLSHTTTSEGLPASILEPEVPPEAMKLPGGTLEHVIGLQILHVPDCPGAEALDGRLAPLLANLPGIRVTWQVVATEEDAARLGTTGSPTILADGADPSARPGLESSLSCRLYRDENGRLGPAPSVAQLRQVLGLGTP